MFTLREILEKTAHSEMTIEEAEKLIRLQAIAELEGIAKIDYNREYRKGIPEIILAENKTVEDTVDISLKMLQVTGRVIISRCTLQHIDALKATVPADATCQINRKAKMVTIKNKNYTITASGGRIGLLTAGTSDIAVAEEVKTIAEEMGCTVYAEYDIGVAGIHRLLEPLKDFVQKDVDVLVVVAGREGALPSVIAGMINVPVIAVPTSNSYGFGEKGVSTLMAMLQSCSLGIAVVNIDSGIAAGATATLIANRAAKFRK
ncbi:MAG: nickel pincer cofactor biosynthesis protein LarB [Candidatus Bathyarchaeota archaeon]|uniref:nickel pincer cofactor biosynthesis protein LarB n=1 Tax=Candidatus Bathycorpusculum sp. TaxID=2994959 RepID=UPI00281B0AEC|nr:nickel pincer cofactor biosynthesis protein LarB [Candidatus Termiticorpusculum sp.]MCL2257565.1 nickel pincer cofactor biosynthesis protein LarB [Candidatus Termiticorpusculum sp.]MCL2292300.1 nickel pincer cofactor biosynthesis protein LarB [Candidatus Termiticorpusculum sp.]